MSGKRSSSLFGEPFILPPKPEVGGEGERRKAISSFLLRSSPASFRSRRRSKICLEARAGTVPEVEEVLPVHLEADVFQLGEIERDISFDIGMFRARHQVKDHFGRQGGQDVVDHLPGDGRRRDEPQDHALPLVLADPDPLAHPGAHAEVLRQPLRVVRGKGIEQREERAPPTSRPSPRGRGGRTRRAPPAPPRGAPGAACRASRRDGSTYRGRARRDAGRSRPDLSL